MGKIYTQLSIEERAMIQTPMGHFVMVNACQQLAKWAIQAEMMHLTMSINVSAKQFHHDKVIVKTIIAMA